MLNWIFNIVLISDMILELREVTGKFNFVKKNEKYFIFLNFKVNILALTNALFIVVVYLCFLRENFVIVTFIVISR